jgi:peptidoglycan/xylan/chitin deacetylase (PgdA/CDA1 family)
LLKTATKVAAQMLPARAYRRLIKRRVLGLFYHVVSDERLPHVENLYPYKTPEMFEHDLRYLRQHFALLSEQDLRSVAKHDLPKRPMSIAVTFDDGFSECASVVRPILLKHAVPCFFFVTTNFLDNKSLFYRSKVSLCIDALTALDDSRGNSIARDLAELGAPHDWNRAELAQWLLSLGHTDEPRVDAACSLLGVDVASFLRTRRPYLTRDEVRRLAEDGFTVGAHSKTHARLGLLSEDELEEEIVGSSRIVMQLTGRDQVPFAFPHSSAGVERAVLQRILVAHDYIWPLFDGGLARRDEFIVNRLWADRPSRDGTRSDLARTIQRGYYDYLISLVP